MKIEPSLDPSLSTDAQAFQARAAGVRAVSYTHLTLPTILLV